MQVVKTEIQQGSLEGRKKSMPKGVSRCKYCNKLIPSALKSEHLENRCTARKRHKRLIKYIRDRL